MTLYQKHFKGFPITIDSINLKKVCKSFCQTNGNLNIFKNISTSFHRGNSYAIVGSSGSGKSTLLHMIAGIEPLSSGSVNFNNTNIQKLPIQDKINLLQHNIGIIFQQSLLIHELSVIENIMLKQIIQGKLTANHQEHAQQLLSNINLLDKANCMPNVLSGGQQQRIALLRAIFQTPQFLLADEPTGNLDKTSSEQVIQLMFDYQKKYAMGLIISTHDMNIAQQCDYIVKIENKEITLIA